MVRAPELLVSDESSVLVENITGKSDVILVCEHAGKLLPEEVGSLGISDAVLESHIGWDLGAAALSREVARLLDSTLILQRYSRLVYDCNRSLDAIDAIVEQSDDVYVPGNANLDADQRQQRFELVYKPFFESINAIIQDRMTAGAAPIIVTIHSFTPIYQGQQRDTELGVIHDTDARLADSLLSITRQQQDYQSARNEPYSAEDDVTHTLITHGINNQLLNVMFEIRSDLISDVTSQQLWAQRLAALIRQALRDVNMMREN